MTGRFIGRSVAIGVSMLVAISGLAMFMFMTIAQRQILYAPPPESQDQERQAMSVYNVSIMSGLISIQTKDGIDIRAYWQPYPDASEIGTIPTILYFHVKTLHT